MEEVDGNSEVGDEFWAGDKEEEEDYTIYKLQCQKNSSLDQHLSEGKCEKTHLRKLFNIHTNPNIHPTVVSPLNASQLRTKSTENAVPYTTVVNRISTVAVA